jgi:2-dehydropantoate 2-reductase
MILLTTKTYETDRAIARHRGPVPVLLSGGVAPKRLAGNLEKIEERWDGSGAWRAGGSPALKSSSPGRVRITVSADAIHIGGCAAGSFPPHAKRLAEALRSRRTCRVSPVEDIFQSLYAKLLYNCDLTPARGHPRGPLRGFGRKRGNTDDHGPGNRETFAVIAAMGGNTAWPELPRPIAGSSTAPWSGYLNHRCSMLQDLDNPQADRGRGHWSVRGGPGKKIRGPHTGQRFPCRPGPVQDKQQGLAGPEQRRSNPDG